jgi:CubicO group peptidase (beta-lactamase class C family)
MLRTLAIQLLGAAGIVAASTLECHPEGPIVPRPEHVAKSKSFQAALKKLTGTLDDATSGKIKPGWDTSNVSMSVSVVSLDQEASNVPLWEYHHLASGNVNGTKAINRNSQYLIGSVSKIISDAILLRSDLNIDDPITKYLPKLSNSSSLIQWDNITLRALASHLSGIPPNCQTPHPIITKLL